SGKGGAEAARGAGAGEIGVRHELGDRREPPLELRDLLRRRTLLGPVEPRGVREPRADVAGNARANRPEWLRAAKYLAEPRAAVNRGYASEAEENRAGAAGERGGDELAEAAARRTQRVELVRTEEREPDRSRRLDDGGA